MADQSAVASGRAPAGAVTIRHATDADGPAIGKLYKTADWPDHGVDWTRPGIRGWWLVAEREDGEVVGAIQAVASAPYGYIGDFVVHPDYRKRDTEHGAALTARLGDVAFDLLVTAFIALRAAGSQMVLGAIGKESAASMAIYARHGAMNLGEYTLMARRLS
mgnify:CR=1 FL=1